MIFGTMEKAEESSSNLRVGISNFDNLNPLISQNQNIQDISKLIYEPLFNLTDEFRLEKALGVEVSKADSQVYFVKLREDVKWHNGSDFVAADVKFTIDSIKALGNNSIYNLNVSNIANVEILSNYLLKIYLNEEVPFFEYNLTFPIICSSFFESEDVTTSEKNNVPMGTGKYKLQSVDISSQIELKQNTNWWNVEKEKLRIDTITVRIYGTIAEVYNAYKLGGIDLISSQSLNAEDTIGTIGSNISQIYGRNFDYLALNNSSSLLSKKEVREALNYGINKSEIINSVYSGKYIAADYPLEYGSYLYNKTESYNYNVDKAKQILQDNGWVYTSYGYWQKQEGYNYLRLRLNLVVQASNEARVKVSEIIKNNLEGVGIPVNIIKANDATYESYMKNKNYDILLTGVVTGINPDLRRYFGTGNLANYSNNEALEILKDIYNISDEKVLKEKYERLQKMYETDRPYIGLYFGRNVLIYGKKLNTAGKSTWHNIFYDIENWNKKN